MTASSEKGKGIRRERRNEIQRNDRKIEVEPHRAGGENESEAEIMLRRPSVFQFLLASLKQVTMYRDNGISISNLP